MDWATAEAKFFERNGRKISSQEHNNWHYQGSSWFWSVPHLWSYRGRLWKKYEGSYPKAEDVGLEPGHWFFDTDHIDVSKTQNINGKVTAVTVRWRGREIKPGHRMYPKVL